METDNCEKTLLLRCIGILIKELESIVRLLVTTGFEDRDLILEHCKSSLAIVVLELKELGYNYKNLYPKE